MPAGVEHQVVAPVTLYCSGSRAENETAQVGESGISLEIQQNERFTEDLPCVGPQFASRSGLAAVFRRPAVRSFVLRSQSELDVYIW